MLVCGRGVSEDCWKEKYKTETYQKKVIFKFEIVTKIIYITNGGITLETVELRFQYTQSEYIKAERQYLISSKTIHKYDIALVAVFLLLSVIYMLFSSFSVFSILIFGLIIVVTALGSYLYILMPIDRKSVV